MAQPSDVTTQHSDKERHEDRCGTSQTGDTHAVTDEENKTVNKLTEFRYGWFGITPSFLQWLNNATAFAIIMTLANIFQSGTMNGLIGAVQSSIETRFQLTSTQSSMIILTKEFVGIPLAIFVAYKGTKGCHRPRWTAAFLFISAIGCFIYAIPHFTTPLYIPNVKLSDSLDGLCFRNATDACKRDSQGDQNQPSLQWYLAMFIIGRCCLSFGFTSLFNFAITYIDDCLTRDRFTLYSSLLAMASALGPAIGYIVGGLLLELYTDFPDIDVENNLDFDSDDPRWVGAWWLGYIGAGIGGILTLLPMTGFPRDIPGADEIRAKKTNEASGVKDDPTIINLKIDFK